MINTKLIFRIFGALLNIEAAFMFLCLVVSLCCHEGDMVPLAITFGVTVAVSLLFILLGRGASNTLSRRDAYLLVSLVWIAFAAFGSLPFLLGGYIDNVSDAFFETMSGLTTTGATTIDHVEGMPHGVLLWRSLNCHFAVVRRRFGQNLCCRGYWTGPVQAAAPSHNERQSIVGRLSGAHSSMCPLLLPVWHGAV